MYYMMIERMQIHFELEYKVFINYHQEGMGG